MVMIDQVNSVDEVFEPQYVQKLHMYRISLTTPGFSYAPDEIIQGNPISEHIATVCWHLLILLHVCNNLSAG